MNRNGESNDFVSEGKPDNYTVGIKPGAVGGVDAPEKLLDHLKPGAQDKGTKEQQKPAEKGEESTGKPSTADQEKQGVAQQFSERVLGKRPEKHGKTEQAKDQVMPASEDDASLTYKVRANKAGEIERVQDANQQREWSLQPPGENAKEVSIKTKGSTGKETVEKYVRQEDGTYRHVDANGKQIDQEHYKIHVAGKNLGPNDNHYGDLTITTVNQVGRPKESQYGDSSVTYGADGSEVRRNKHQQVVGMTDSRGNHYHYDWDPNEPTNTAKPTSVTFDPAGDNASRDHRVIYKREGSGNYSAHDKNMTPMNTSQALQYSFSFSAGASIENVGVAVGPSVAYPTFQEVSIDVGKNGAVGVTVPFTGSDSNSYYAGNTEFQTNPDGTQTVRTDITKRNHVWSSWGPYDEYVQKYRKNGKPNGQMKHYKERGGVLVESP